MLFGGLADFEVRSAKSGGGRIISGAFPYNKTAVLSDGGKTGRPRKEKFAARAFRYSVEVGDLDIHFLWGHSFDKALASRNAESLKLTDTAKALEFEAKLSEDVLSTSHGKDFMRMLSAGLVAGISPGFRVAPRVEGAESVEEEPPEQGNALIRTINAAVLYELSAVVRPAYTETEIQARNWQPTQHRAINCTARPEFRWR